MKLAKSIRISSPATLLSSAGSRLLAATALLAFPAAALADDTFGTAIAITPGDTAGTISPVGDLDYFKFTIDSAQTIIIATKTAAVGSPATMLGLRLYDSSGSGNFDYSGSDRVDPEITKFLQPGTYYVRVTSLRHTGAYRLVLKTQSGAIPMTQMATGNFDVPNDWENYRFTITSPGYVELGALRASVSTPPVNLTMIVRDEAGRQVGYRWGAEAVFADFMNPGNYFVTVTPRGNVANTGDFRLKLISPDNAMTIGQGTHRDAIDVPNDQDYYRFVVPGNEPRTIRLGTSGSVYLQLVLRDGHGQQVLRGNALLGHDREATLNPGVYFLQLSGYNSSGAGSYGDYALTLSGLSPAAPEISILQQAGGELVAGMSKYAFGTTAAGSKKGITRTFTIRNTGGSSLTGIKVARGGKHAGDFVVKSLPATSLADGAQTTFTVTFAPKKTGRKTAWLRVVSNDADESSFDIPVTGLAVRK